MTALTDRIAEVLYAELDEHGCEDDDEKRWQVAQHWAQRIAEALQLAEEWAIEFTDSLDNAPDRYEVLDREPSLEVKDRCRSFPSRALVTRWVSAWSAAEEKPPNTGSPASLGWGDWNREAE